MLRADHSAWTQRDYMEELVKAIGHDGMRIDQTDLPEPLCRVGFHPQEFFWPLLRWGYCPVLVDLDIAHTPGYDRVRRLNHWGEVEGLIRKSYGVIFTEHHAVANCGGVISDCKCPGALLALEHFDFEIISYVAVIQSKSRL